MSVSILVGDVRDRLRDLPDESVDIVVTSPPYWGLRDYGVEGQIGLEPTLGEHLEVMVLVFREVRRVLKPSGTLWLNYGDCYAAKPNGRSAADTKALGEDDRTFRDKPFSTVGPIYERGQSPAHTAGRQGRSGNLGNGGINGAAVPDGRVVAGGYLKPKDLCMVPNRLAIALQEDGWWVRSEIIWAKANPMPESITDRPATAHEKIFLLTKAARYFYDPTAVRQEPAGQTVHDLTGGGYAPPGQPPQRGSRANYRAPTGWDTSVGEGVHGKVHKDGRRKQDAIAASVEGAGGTRHRRTAGFNERWAAGEGRRKADSFARASKNTPGEHGQKPQHRPDREEVSYLRGAGRNLRNYEPAPVHVWNIATLPFKEAHFATFPPELAQRCLLAGCPKGGLVLDPFGGAGTVGLVADRMGLDCTLIELNEEYAELARRRIASEQGMFPAVAVANTDQGRSLHPELPLAAAGGSGG